MNMTEEELVAELAKDGETLESVAARGRAALERAKVEADARSAIRTWLRCPKEKRPSPEALGQLIASIAAKFPI